MVDALSGIPYSQGWQLQRYDKNRAILNKNHSSVSDLVSSGNLCLPIHTSTCHHLKALHVPWEWGKTTLGFTKPNLKIWVAEYSAVALVVEDEVVIHITLGPVRSSFQHGAGPQTMTDLPYTWRLKVRYFNLDVQYVVCSLFWNGPSETHLSNSFCFATGTNVLSSWWNRSAFRWNNLHAPLEKGRSICKLALSFWSEPLNSKLWCLLDWHSSAFGRLLVFQGTWPNMTRSWFWTYCHQPLVFWAATEFHRDWRRTKPGQKNHAEDLPDPTECNRENTTKINQGGL